MTELDFDELDKAVNSLMGDADNPVSNTNPEGASPVANVSSPSTTASLAASGNSTDTNNLSETPLSKPAASLATKRRGRFMDIVRPSSTTRPTMSAERRQSIVIAPSTDEPSSSFAAAPSPISPDSTTVVTTEENSESNLSQESPVATAEESGNEQPAVVNEWPDPIETTSSDQVTSEATQTEASDGDAAPLESPFLADAKPEKRPLGALQQSSQDLLTAEVAPASDDPQVSSIPSAMPESTALPDELHSNVMAIESDTTTLSENNTATVAQAVLDPLPENTPQPKVQELSPISESIPQQYKEEPSSGDQTNGSIYDTANYHKAIEAHAPEKHNSVLKWVMWGVLLVVLGAGGGAAYFLFTR